MYQNDPKSISISHVNPQKSMILGQYEYAFGGQNNHTNEIALTLNSNGNSVDIVSDSNNNNYYSLSLSWQVIEFY